MDKKMEEMIINFGSFGYDSDKMSNILGVDISSEFANPNSEFSRLYKKGVDLADYAIDIKLFELARNGDIKALNKLDARKRGRR